MKNWFNKDQHIRLLVQSGFLLLILWIGFQFYGFVRFYQTGGQTPFIHRPPGVEGFLPISSLMGIKYFLLTGSLNRVHPAGIVLMTVFILFAILMKKGFCGWICPVGFLSEYLGKLGKKVVGKNFILPKWLDYPLRSLKYLLLIFFLWVIVAMSSVELQSFLNGNYNKIADVEMLMFFWHISMISLIVIFALVILSVFIRNFWCRYLCPYGAFLGFLSMFSPLKVTRNPDTCTSCQRCTKACPAHIQIHEKLRIKSDECMACGECLAICPEENTLGFSLTKQLKRTVPVRLYAGILVAVFVIVTSLAMATGYWKSNVKPEVYKDWGRHILENPK
ncbi:MAG: 4Fe-4S binding protein [Bacteroidales bacterium]|nr:4Fe-4S binding protein [Bacteroidales bacterium]